VALPDRLCVVADDEMFLSVYHLDGTAERRVPLWPGVLPDQTKERKRLKPDAEAITLLPDASLLVLGSGSTAMRARGAVVDPARDFAVREVDLTALWRGLSARLPELNIEGAAVIGDRLWLMQRGNGTLRANACIELDLARVMTRIERDACIDAGCVRAIHPVALGELDGVPLSFTDATPLAGGELLFSAAAESSPNTYEDGPLAGAVVGWLALPDRVKRVERVEPAHKIEGVALAHGDDERELWLVADPDDRSRRAPLLRASLGT
jgi:hypothetical protein